ncbi:MAG: extracellular solute-binding protein [Mesorhizobium sp.]|uniref:extracellular solute-binding protein n=1 Tax=Mesorhizobium sp. TaxID=1871066 RepID=UPI0011FEC8D1|nr:extracellular solute-binding protein [Mesorhizobium sp.]TIN32507.1 MAG: extracellular solute-binding protein [Mesorhizobium sp.]TJU83712.1 MAG: extracellular solute-binding protein [Mesorhizobium sp.]
MINRRHLLGYGGLAVAAGLFPASMRSAWAAMDPLAEEAIKAGQTEVVVAGGTGAYEESVKKFIYDPFTAETGIRVVSTGGSYGEKLARIKAMTQVGNMEWDVATLSADSLTQDNLSFFRNLGEQCEETPNVVKAGVDGACLRYGVIFDVGAGVMAYDQSAFPNATQQPSSWVDFWDVSTFPGPRALPNIGTPWWPLIAALLADGVAADTVFPLDLDRAFRKLDEIKPHVTVWWRSGDQAQQIFRTKEVVMAMMFLGRTRSLQAEGLPIGISWNGAPLDASAWMVLTQAPRPLAALALLNFVYTRPQAHASYTELGGAATAMKTAAEHMKAEEAAQLPTSAIIWPQLVKMDRAWLSKNRNAAIQRWTEWIAQ